jgi:beta-lactamase regulating signal transducer with metallopeptidase domain
MLTLLLEAAVRSLGLGVLVWFAFKLWRTSNPRAELTAWTAVLAASLAMPLLMQWSPDIGVTIPAVVRSSADLVIPVSDVMDAVDAAEIPAKSSSLPWGLIALAVYALVAAGMILRLGAGLILSQRLRRNAVPLPDSALHGLDIRMSSAIAAPMAIASTILVPRDYPAWPAFKRNAILAHEAAHVARGDFYIQVAARLNRAVFWFSPLSWWLYDRLALLAENASDAAALDTVSEPVVYAEVLFEFAQRAGGGIATAVPMARPNTVAHRIEHILSGQPLPGRLSMKKHLLVFATVAPLIALSAGLQMAVPHAALAATGAGQVRDLPAFHAVSFSSSGDVDISVGKAQAVSIEANAALLARVTTEVRDGTLYIGRRNDDGDHDSGPLAVHISMPRLDGMKLSGSGAIALDGLNGGATTVGISGSGSLRAKGHLDKLALSISGSGNADLPDLTVEDATVKVSGSGNIKIKANKTLDAQISGSGDVRYYGTPQIESRVSGSGSIGKAN